MPQNQFTSKASFYIGITLFIGIISFTVFINIPEQEDIEYKIFTQNELDDLWELRGKQQHFMQQFFPVNDSVSIDIAITNHSTHQTGTLRFITNTSDKSKLPKLLHSEIIECNTDSSYIKRIEEIYMYYQIYTISTEMEEGDFTRIELRDGRILYLMGRQQNSSHSRVLERVKFINDSTKVIHSSTVQKIENNIKEEQKIRDSKKRWFSL